MSKLCGTYSLAEQARQIRRLRLLDSQEHSAFARCLRAALASGESVTDTELPDIQTHKLCRSCGEWLKPEYGSLKAPGRGTLFTPAALVRDVASDALSDTSHHYFLCYDCEHKRKTRRIYLFGGLAVLVALAYLAKYLLDS